MDAPVVEISAREAAERLRLAPDRTLLLDVREADELQLARIPGALHIPMGDIPSRLPQLDPQREIIVLCHHGRRSYHVAAFLLKQDFPNVASLRGGIEAWANEVDPSVGRY